MLLYVSDIKVLNFPVQVIKGCAAIYYKNNSLLKVIERIGQLLGAAFPILASLHML